MVSFRGVFGLKNVLIVIPGDREILNPLRRLVETLLNEIRFVPAKVIGTSSRTQALGFIQRHRTDLLLIEHTAPRINGFHFVQSIPNRSSIKRVVLVAKVRLTLDEMEQLIRVGIHSALERPLNRDELKQVLRKVLLRAEAI